MDSFTFELLYDHTLNFAMYNNDVALIKKLKLSNHRDEPLQNIQIEIAFWPGFASVWKQDINEIPANASIDLGAAALQINPEFLYSLSERIKGQMLVKISAGQEMLAENVYDLQILAFDEWNGNVSIPEIIAAFIVPNSPIVNSVLKSAAEYMKKWTGDSSMDAYQSNDPNRVKQQMAAIYQALADWKIDYVSAPASFEERGQKVRLPEDIETHKLGTCLDLALLYASVLEAANLNPIIVVIKGHAFAGCWLINECFPEGVFDDYSLLSKRAADGINEICLVECTALTDVRALKFDAAVAAGTGHLADTAKFYYFVDVKRARISQIRPLPLRRQFVSYHELAEAEKKEMPLAEGANAPSRLGKIEFTESTDPIVKTRIDNWQRQLLDLSLRNSLINFRHTANAITILCPDLFTLEDSLSSGKEFQLLPVPQELSEQVRDLEIYKLRTGNAFLTALTEQEFAQNRLRTLLGASELNRTIVNIYRKAKLAMEENGANVLYLGIGLLKWYENNAAVTARVAPLLLVPMEIIRKSSAFGYVIKMRDDESIFNVTLIQYIQSVFGKDLSSLETMPQDDNGVDVRTLFAIVRKYIMDMPRWEIEESAVLSVFSFNKFVMWNDLKNRSGELQKNRIVSSLIRGVVDNSFSEEAAFDAIDLDREIDPSEIVTPASADSSQLSAVYAASKGKSFVLHGPPGTGKSQTITNMIATLLGSGKTVLFVAEKMAALSVVQKRLENLGLAPFCMELHSNKSNKKDILKKLEETLNLGLYKSAEDWETVSSELFRLRQELNQYVEALHNRHEIGFSLYEVLNRLNGLKKYKAKPFFTPEFAYSYTKERFTRAADFVRRLAIAGAGCGHPFENAWAGIALDAYSSTSRDRVAQLCETNAAQMQKLLAENHRFMNYFHITQQAEYITYDDIKALQALYRQVQLAPGMGKELLLTEDFMGLKPALLTFIALSRNYFALQAQLYENYSEGVEEIAIDEWIGEFNMSNEKFILVKMLAQNKIYKRLVSYARLGRKPDKKNLAGELQRIKTYMDARAKYNAAVEEGKTFFGAKWGVSAELDALEGIVLHAEELHRFAGKISSEEIRHAVKNNLYEINRNKERAGFSDVAAEMLENCDALFAMLLAGGLHQRTIGALRGIIYEWGQQLQNLQGYCLYNKVKKEAEALEIYEVVTAYENGELENNDVESAFYQAFYHAWSDEAIMRNIYLSSFSKELEEDKIAKFAGLDNRYMLLARQEIGRKLVLRLPKNGQSSNPNSEVGLLIRAIHSQGRGMALRKLFDSIPNLLNRLSPCMLMSPISVAQYLDTNFPPFDVILFDEASQMPTYEAIGAIARGRELIVVGDPKQLPPTAFFSNKPVEQDEELVLQDLESILDDCLAINMPQKHLTWHYRSKHESLIAFSNYNFYDGKLLTFPSCDDIVCKTNLIRVEGYYDRGGTRQNAAEADAVVDEIVRLVFADCTKSIGVVTFNQAQQILIEDTLEERVSKDTALERQLAQQVNEPLFVKNLENVQGDERDIIIFSIGYGRDANGYMSMNFGPINQNGGWRRLNVAISRARESLLVYASICGDDINLAKTKSMGVMYLKNFLDYARNGVSALTVPAGALNAGTDENSEIENEIYERLLAQGYQVDRHVGTSKYKLPLAVVSKKTGKYILGIEFDGLMFQSAETARDREILINGVLKGLHWNIFRVWTQKWFAAPEEEFEQLLDKLAFYEAQSEMPETFAAAAFENILMQEPVTEVVMPEEANGQIYRAAVVENVSLRSEAFYEASSTKILKAQINEIVQNESPVSFAGICRKIVSAWGMKRAGGRIEERLHLICGGLGLQKTEFNGLEYYWDKETDIENYTGYRVSQSDSDRRNVEDIAPEEIINATVAVLQEQISLAEADLAKEVAKKFGYMRLAESTAAKFVTVMQLGADKNVFQTDNNKRYTIA